MVLVLVLVPGAVGGGEGRALRRGARRRLS